MVKLLLGAAFASLLLSLSGVCARADGIVAQYWPAYSRALQAPPAIPWDTLSIAYNFVVVTTPDGMAIGGGQLESDIPKFVKDAHHYGKKAVFTVGGWDGGLYLSEKVGSAANRTKFVEQIYDFTAKDAFDGVDFDWEYPNSQGIGCNTISPKDSSNFLLFLQALRVKYGTKKLITAATGLAPFNDANGTPMTDVSAFGKVLDYINVMVYDVSGAWSATTGPNGPLSTCNADGSVVGAVEAWTGAKFPASKILVGIPSYGHSWTTKSSTLSKVKSGAYSSQLYQTFVPTVPKGDHTDVGGTSTDVCGVESSGYSGQWTYVNMIAEGILSADGLTGLKGYTRYWDKCTQTPFLFNFKTRDFIAYDDAQSVTAKGHYAYKNGLAGVMIFDSVGFNRDVLSVLKGQLVKSAAARCRK